MLEGCWFVIKDQGKMVSICVFFESVRLSYFVGKEGVNSNFFIVEFFGEDLMEIG